MRNTSHLRTRTHWNIAIRPLPLRLGYLMRLEDGPLYRGPNVLLGLSWWWRPTWNSAVLKGYVEIEKYEAAQ